MQENMNAAAIALTFNTHNTRKVWSARANSRDNLERVHFSTDTGMVKLVYDVRERTFTVQFTKVHAAWGDYVRAIARALHVVLSTLKAGGLPFDAPDDDEGVVIRTVTGLGGAITVAYEPPMTLANAVMPEQRALPVRGEFLGVGEFSFDPYSGGPVVTDEHYDLGDIYAKFATPFAAGESPEK